MINIKEYKGLTAEYVAERTGLPNPYSDQSKYSLTRQLELMLRDAQNNNVLHLVPKTNVIKHGVVNSMTDKGVTILTKRDEEAIKYTSELDLNSIPHKVVREKGYRTILVQRNDIPLNIVPHPTKSYSYAVIGTFDTRNCFHSRTLYKDNDPSKEKIGTEYRFGHNTHIKLVIVE